MRPRRRKARSPRTTARSSSIGTGRPTAPADRRSSCFTAATSIPGGSQHIVDELRLDDFAMFAWDARGHGRSPGARGDSPSFGASVKDVDVFVRHIAERYGIPIGNIAVIGQSVGAVLAADLGARLCAPRALPRARLARVQSEALRPVRARGARLHGEATRQFLRQLLRQGEVPHARPERIRSYDDDPLITRADLGENPARPLRGCGARGRGRPGDQRPVQLLISGADWVVHHAAAARVLRAPRLDGKEQHVFPGFYHDTLGEKDRASRSTRCAIHHATVRTRRRSAVPLLDAHRAGHTRDEEERHAYAASAAVARRRFSFGADRGSRCARWAGSPKASASARHRLRFRQHARLRLSQPGGRHDPARTHDRPQLSRRDRLARHPRAQAAPRARDRRQPRSACRREGGRCVSSISRRGTAATCSRRVEKLTAQPESIAAAGLQRYQRARRHGADRGRRDSTAIARFVKADAFDEKSLAAIEPRPTSPSSPASTSSSPTMRR